MDKADIASELIEMRENKLIDQIRRQANAIPKGVVGECEYCYEMSQRLVGGACAPCRDRFKLP